MRGIMLLVSIFARILGRNPLYRGYHTSSYLFFLSMEQANIMLLRPAFEERVDHNG